MHYLYSYPLYYLTWLLSPCLKNDKIKPNEIYAK